MRIFLLVFVGLLCVAPLCVAESPRDHAAWWLDQHGVLSAREDPRVVWVEQIFKRVSAAADKKLNRPPRLVLLRSRKKPLALALADGSVLLNRKTLDLMLAGTDRETASARAAFVMGHELAHLAKDDFWDLESLADQADFPELARSRSYFEELLRGTAAASPDTSRSAERTAQLKELQADAHGLISMALAGYDPQKVLADMEGFFSLWTSRDPEQLHTHPPQPLRATLLKMKLQQVRESLHFFHLGTKLLQLERLEDARILLRQFLNRFPGKAVLNNLGLVEYQLAMRFLLACGSRRPVAYMLSTITDTRTLGERKRGSAAGVCLKQREFLQHIERAVSHFRKAERMDPAYRPARINLSSALIIKGDPTGALSILDETLRVESEIPLALNNKAVALHELSRTLGIDTTDRALGIIDRLQRSYPDDPAPLYNQAALLNQRGRHAAAQSSWRKFLQLHPHGAYARAAAEYLEPPLPTPPQVSSADFLPPIPLGTLTPGTRERLRMLPHTAVRLGDFRADFYGNSTLLILVMNSAVELVMLRERAEIKRLPLGSLRTSLRQVPAFGGFTRIYEGVAVDWLHNQPAAVTWFTSPER